MNLDARVAALLRLVEEHRESSCRGHLDPAREDARRMLSEARRVARERVHAAISAQRAAYASQLGRGEARLATRKRMAHQELLQALLLEGREPLSRALAARWREPAARRRWVEAALARALGALPRGEWKVSGPADWPRDERDAAAAWLHARDAGASFATDAGIDAGVRVETGGIVLDATAAGLLADRGAVEGRLLHFLGEGAP